MSQIVQRLAELLDKKSITIAERNEAIALAQTAFGTQSLVVKNDVLNNITSKKVTQPKAAATKKADEPAEQPVDEPDQPVEVTTNDVPEASDEPKTVDVAPGAERNEGAPVEFELGDDKYAQVIRSDGRSQYRLNGKLIAKADFEAAQKEYQNA